MSHTGRPEAKVRRQCDELYFELDSEQSKLIYSTLSHTVFLHSTSASCILIFFIAKSYPAKRVG